MKRIFAFFVVLTMIFVCCSCGISAEKDTGTKQSEEQVESDKKDNVSEDAADETTTKIVVEKQEISFKKAFTVGEVMKINLSGFEWNDRVVSSNEKCSYYYGEEGCKYLLIRGELENKTKTRFNPAEDAVSAKVIINKESYPATMTAESESGENLGENIQGRHTNKIVIYACIPEDVYSECKNVKLNLNIYNEEENIARRFSKDGGSYDAFKLSFENSEKKDKK